MSLKLIPASVITILLATLSMAHGASGSRFDGTWEARIKGSLICTLKLKTGAEITGTMYGCNIRVNDAGDLLESEPAGEPTDPERILNAQLHDNTVTFEMRDPDDESPIRFALRLTGRSRAELTLLNPPMRVKPIHFEKR